MDFQKEIEILKKDRDAWRETALILGDSEEMKSIKISVANSF